MPEPEASEPSPVIMRIAQPGGRDWVGEVGVGDIEATLRNLDWSGPLTVTATSADQVRLAITADGSGNWRAVWQPGIEGVTQVASDLPEGTDDVCRAFAALAAPGSPLLGVLRWQDAPAEPTVPADQVITGTAADTRFAPGRTRPLVSPVLLLAVLVAWGLLVVLFALAIRN